MWVADNLHEMSSLIFSEKKKRFRVSSAVVVISTLRINLFKPQNLIKGLLNCTLGSSLILKPWGKTLDPDEMPYVVASDLGLHCLLRPVCPHT